jgi:hypothetical protein
MLVGANVRLDLRDFDMALEEALRLVTEELGVLEGACQTIGDGTGIALAYPGEEAEGRPSWTSPVGPPLSPKQILMLASLASMELPGLLYHIRRGNSGTLHAAATGNRADQG